MVMTGLNILGKLFGTPSQNGSRAKCFATCHFFCHGIPRITLAVQGLDYFCVHVFYSEKNHCFSRGLAFLVRILHF